MCGRSSSDGRFVPRPDHALFGGRMDVSPARFRALYHRSFVRYIHGIRN